MPAPHSPAASPHPTDDVWTTNRLLRWMTDRFDQADLDSPRLTAEMLLAHVLGCERLRLYMEVDRPASAAEREQLRSLVQRALQHEPVQYLVGEGWFYGMPFEVRTSTLIPRPCTEVLVEHVIGWVRQRDAQDDDSLSILDLGTGSGCIAVALAQSLPQASIIATDLSSDALDLAARNTAKHGLTSRIALRPGDLFAVLTDADRPFHVICSNPPYIPDDQWEGDLVGRNVKGHEPESALRGGRDGLDVISPLLADAPRWLVSGGLLAMEIASVQAGGLRDRLAADAHWCAVDVLKDQEGLPRILTATRT
jgi:release factor glutamine methyltransferase